jgi:transmembrane protein EpsG
MFVVLAFFYVIHTSNQPKHTLNNNDKPSKFIAFIVFGYIVFWAGIRNRFVDTAAYIHTFNMASPNDIASLDISFNSGWGFRLLEIFFKQLISSNYHAWLMFVAIVTGTCIAVTFYKYSHNYFYSVFLFLATTNFTWLMNGIRQFLAVAIIFAATPLIKKNKWFKFILIVLFASTIHGTALMMIPIYFFVRAKPWTSHAMLLLAAFYLFCFSHLPLQASWKTYLLKQNMKISATNFYKTTVLTL